MMIPGRAVWILMKNLLRFALNLDAGNPGAFRFPFDQAANREILMQQVGVFTAGRKPARVPISRHFEAKTDRVYFASHNFLAFPLCKHDGEV